MRLYLLCLVLGVAAFASSCSIFDSSCSPNDRNCLANPLLAKGVGGKCSRIADCRLGLECVDGSCQPTGDTDTGDACRITAECGDADYCGSKRVCQVAGIAAKGASCATTGNCKHGLVCQAPDLSAQGTVSLNALASVSGLCENGGKNEQGEACDDVTDCLAGLTCVDKALVCEITMSCGDMTIEPGSKICASLPASDTELPALPALWQGVSCPEVADDDPKQAYFKVPRPGDDDPAEFYSLPFPNDIRREGDHIDMSNHPSPPDSLGIPLVSRYVEVAGEDPTGFSTNPVVYFRFSHPYDFGSVDADSLELVDITDKSLPEYDKKLGMEWKTTSGNLSNYICPHWLAIKPPSGSPLKPGHTYAAIVTTAIKPESGSTFKRSSDLTAMLADSAPSNSDLKAAYDAYAPLRAWIDDTGRSKDSILNAAVFTTEDPDALVPKLREQVQQDTLPTLSDLTLCESENTKSPCETQETTKDENGKEVTVTRGQCPAPSSDYVVIHGHIRLPVFQKGDEPYLDPSDGGQIELDSNGDPVIQGHQSVCFALSVPTASEPSDGYPVLVYAHGTGGSFNGEMGSGGFATPLAQGTVPTALMAIDMPEHGARRGDSTDDPESLFYNFLNPRAARDNVLQGSADLMAVIRWVKESGGLAADMPLADAVNFDTSRIALMGHSQGATHSSLIASYEPDVVGVVLSGNGGNLATSLLHKTSPVDIASVVPLALMDPDDNFKLAGGEYNPALALIQWVFDPSDPVNFAPHLIRDPTSEVPDGHHVFMTYGIGDTYAPEETQRAYIRAAGRSMVLVEPVLADLKIADEPPWPSEPAPLKDNVEIGSAMRTVGARQYKPSSSSVDGHFVGTRAGEDGRSDVEHFLDQLFAGQSPEIGQ